MSITHYTRVGSSTGEIFVDKIFNNKSTKLFPYIQYKMRKTVMHSSSTCIVETIKVTASSFFFTASCTGIIPGFHGNTDHLIPFVVQHQSCNSTIYTAAHSHQNLSFTAHCKT